MRWEVLQNFKQAKGDSMKKIVKKLTVFVLAMAVAGMLWYSEMPLVQAAENIPVFKVSMDKTKIKAGDKVQVTLELKSGADLSSFMVTLPYDSSKLTCEQITNGNLEDKGLLESADVDGNIRAGFMGTKGIHETVEIFTAQFQIMDNANAADLKFTPQFSDFVFGYGENEQEVDNPSSAQVKTEGTTTLSIIGENGETAESGAPISENDSVPQNQNSEATGQSTADNQNFTDKQNKSKENTDSSAEQKEETGEKVKTGDESPIATYTVIGAAALIIIVGMGVRGIERKDNKIEKIKIRKRRKRE